MCKQDAQVSVLERRSLPKRNYSLNFSKLIVFFFTSVVAKINKSITEHRKFFGFSELWFNLFFFCTDYFLSKAPVFCCGNCVIFMFKLDLTLFSWIKNTAKQLLHRIPLFSPLLPLYSIVQTDRKDGAELVGICPFSGWWCIAKSVKPLLQQLDLLLLKWILS